MEFWGVEVKPGQTLKCPIEEGKLLHLSQAALGDSKNKTVESVPIFVRFNDQKLVLGTLSSEKCPQIQYDLVFEKEFELSHGSKNASVCFCGYMTSAPDDCDDDSHSGEDDSDFNSDDSEDDLIAVDANEIKANEQEKPAAGKTNAAADNSTVEAKTKKVVTVKVDPNPNDDSSEDSEDESDDDDGEDDSEDESDDGEDMVQPAGDSDDDEDSSDDEDEDEETPKKAAVSGKKRPAESPSKTPAPEKKAKVISPAGQKTGGNAKKGAHTATPHPAKQAGKAPPSGDKAKQQTPKSAGSVSCKECNKSFNSGNALQSHNKAKHSASK